MKRFVIPLTLCAVLSACHPDSGSLPAYLNPKCPIEERVEDALSRMTVEEKVAMCHAQSKFSSAGVPRLGIPDNWASDGPHGIRAEVLWDEWYGAGWTCDSCTAYPALTCLAATWNREMALRYGKSLGEEARYRNKNILLGPGVNIYRQPLNGRNFEYMGEDPYLASQMVVPYIKGVQQNKVAACVKHFILNNQETDRDRIEVEVDDRALNEIYLPAFKAAVKEGGTWAIMGSYNRYKGEYCCHNRLLLNDLLKGEWGFDGVVVSDWGGTHDTDQSINNGLDMEFGTWTDGMGWGRSNAYSQYYLADAYLERLKNGTASQEVLDDKVRRILRLVFRTTMADRRPSGSFASPEHAVDCRTIAQEGIVLLKNDRKTLPLDAAKLHKIVVVGENAVKRMTIGGGSSSLKVKKEVSPLEGIRARAGEGCEVVYAEGYRSPAVMEQDVKDAVVPKQKAIDHAALLSEAVGKAADADAVIYVGGLNKNTFQDCEGADRQSYSLPYGQDMLIEALAAANPNLVIVLVSGNAVAMPWVDKASSIVQSWYCGSEAGNAIASILFGDANPSGKLPFTFPVALSDNGAIATGSYGGDGDKVVYSDGILVGYRWYEKKNIKPLFPFGHGLSYTQFEYGDAKLSRKSIHKNQRLKVDIDIKNVGDREGGEVVQLYVGAVESSVLRPVKELKGFEKIFLRAGEKRRVRFTLTRDDLAFYDSAVSDWRAEAGRYEIYIGSSSEDIRAVADFKLKE